MKLRPNQTAAADAVEEAFRAGITRPLVDSCVGSGKSLTMAEVARREVERGGRALIVAHVRELVEQNANACRAMGLRTGINAAALGERTWRAPVISAAIQSIYKNAHSFGPISLLCVDESHLLPHSEAGMYRALHRALGYPRMPGFSGTVFRLQGGSLVEGEGAPFEKVVYRYSILDGIRDGYLVPAFSAPAEDKIDPNKLRVRQGEYAPDAQDAQMIEAMDNHIAQLRLIGAARRKWLLFEASTKAAKLMTARMNEWGIPTGLVLGTTSAAERIATIAAYRQGRLRALVNVAALTTGFDVQEVDMLVMRRRTKSLGLYIQMCGRLLRTIGGNLDASIAAGKADGLVVDFAGNIDEHGALDLIRPKDTPSRLVSCESCGKRNATAAMKCWSCDEPMTKNCPACLEPIRKGLLDCPLCGHDMRVGGDPLEPKPQKLLERPSGAALIASYKTGSQREGGWSAVRRVWTQDGVTTVTTDDQAWEVTGTLQGYVDKARWLRAGPEGRVDALLVPNGSSRNSVLQVTLAPSGEVIQLPVPMPSQVHESAA